MRCVPICMLKAYAHETILLVLSAKGLKILEI